MPKVRTGKTRRDKESGAWGNRFHNRAARLAWQRDNSSTLANFPYHTCNGKKNRAFVTGPKGQRVCVIPSSWARFKIVSGG